MVPPLKKHAVMLQSMPTATHPSPVQTIVPGEVVTPDVFQGSAFLSYWREDYDYNDHHVHWHMVFPGTGVVVNGKNVKVIDRQGELFLYMHSQMVARYETEGLCWNLPLVRPWNQYDDVLEQGYVPVPGLAEYYGGYPPFSRWFATKNPNIPDTPDQPVPRALLETWRDNIYQAIKDGYFWTKDKDGNSGNVMLTEDNCHNLVGMVIEAESDDLQILPDGSWPDHDLYGNLHNFGHDKFAELGYHLGVRKILSFPLTTPHLLSFFLSQSKIGTRLLCNESLLPDDFQLWVSSRRGVLAVAQAHSILWAPRCCQIPARHYGAQGISTAFKLHYSPTRREGEIFHPKGNYNHHGSVTK